MKLSEWATQQGISYRTAWRWVKNNTMPVPFTQTSTGTIIVHPEIKQTNTTSKTVAYARVSSSDQKQDLDRQVARIAQSGYKIDQYITETGSALNGSRPKLKKILTDPEVTTIIVEHRDRLTRFGYDHLAAALKGRGTEIIVLDNAELEDDLVRDVTDVLTSLCARRYGKRSAENRAKRAIQSLETDE